MKTETKILAIETASEACSATLLTIDKNSNDSILDIHKQAKVFNQVELTPRQHAKKILSMLDSVLKQGSVELNEVDAIAFGQGPGAFTGLRIATGIAQGVSLAVDKPVVPVSTLAALALEGVIHYVDNKKKGTESFDKENTIFAAALDARMGEVYWGLYKLTDGNIELIGKEQVSKPKAMFKGLLKTTNEMNNVQMVALGAGWDTYHQELLENDKPKNLVYFENIYPTSSSISKIALSHYMHGETVISEEAQPVYIRNDVAKKSQKQ